MRNLVAAHITCYISSYASYNFPNTVLSHKIIFLFVTHYLFCLKELENHLIIAWGTLNEIIHVMECMCLCVQVLG